ncbi:hypothetical protein WJX75_009335 [Coccomyxa subellipsoidea]|uniref:Ubiquitin-like domain-containing protein n=1 Tax=Coccomyxa subellipsoidea TaxID=248742 RepID=A0ABR2YBL2_9CHLO
MQIFFNKVSALEVEAQDTIELVKIGIEAKSGIPCCHQRLIYAGRQLQDDMTLEQCAVEAGSTLHLVLRLRGGKGGFGALLRGAGRSALTDNFDACRDLSGRRLRHVNAEQKLAEWAAGAKERELEKVGLKHIRAQEKAALREARAQVDMDDIRTVQDAALERAKDAVASALAGSGSGGNSPVKRPAAGPAAAGPAAKKRRPSKRTFGVDDELSSDSEDDEEEEMDAPSLNNSCIAMIVKEGGTTTASLSSDGSEQEPLHLDAAGQSPSAQASASVLEAAAPAAEPIAAATSVVDSNAAAPSSLDLAQVGSTAAMMEAAVSSVGDAAAADPAPGASVVDSNLKDRRQSNAEVTTEAVPAEPLDLSQYSSAAELESLGLERLKGELQRLGLKHTALAELDKKHLVKPPKKA